MDPFQVRTPVFSPGLLAVPPLPLTFSVSIPLLLLLKVLKALAGLR
jgi:hypothetical protein